MMDENGNLIEEEQTFDGDTKKKKLTQYITTEQADGAAELGFTTTDSAREF